MNHILFLRGTPDILRPFRASPTSTGGVPPWEPLCSGRRAAPPATEDWDPACSRIWASGCSSGEWPPAR